VRGQQQTSGGNTGGAEATVTWGGGAPVTRAGVCFIFAEHKGDGRLDFIALYGALRPTP
jgi:hypothetical protein